MNVEELLLKGELGTIKAWLREHIHQYGQLKNTDQMLLATTGETFNADYYVAYLKEKFTKVYGL